MGYKIEVTPQAVEDLGEIVFYITEELENPTAASSFLDEVDKCYTELETMPYLYEECRNPQLKALQPSGCYQALHHGLPGDEASNIVYVLRFFYGARDYEKLI